VRIPAGKLSAELTDPAFARHLGLLTDHGLALDIKGLGDFAGAVRLARAYPGLRIVVDHVGNVRDPQAPDLAWREGMRRLGAEPNVYCKLSGLVETMKTPHGGAPTDVATYRPTLDHVTASFGPTRVLYGSNWPVSDKGARYADVFGLVADYYAERSAEERERFFWRNSLEAYRWISRGA
jgi:predicted TIM-barrel fold metal-dependent hydrolase